jgi:SecD/SecF fusion protein
VDLDALADSLTDRESIAFHPVVGADSGAPAVGNLWDDAPGPADRTDSDSLELTEEELEELLGGDASGGGAPGFAPEPAELVVTDESGQELQLGAAELRGDAVLDARPGQQGTSWTLDITFTPEGAEGWRRLTGNAACHGMEEPRRRVAIVLGEELLSAPAVTPDVVCGVGISGDTTSIAGPAGNFDLEGTREMADRTLLGELYLPVEVVEIS